MEKTKNAYKTIINVIHWVIIALLAFTSLSLVLSTFDNPLHLRVFSVNSGSMAPAIRTGSLVFIRPSENYEVNDVITYAGKRDRNNTTTHRIHEISVDEDIGVTTYRTKGDANEDPDNTLVNESQIIGKVIFKVPLLGYVSAFAKTQMGFIFLIVIPATLIVYSEIANVKKEVESILKARKNANAQ